MGCHQRGYRTQRLRLSYKSSRSFCEGGDRKARRVPARSRDDFKFWSLVSRTRFHSKSKARTSDQVHGNNTRVGDTSIANREFSPSRNLREACEEVPFLAGRGAVVVTFRHTSSFMHSSCTPLYTEPSIACDLRVKPVPSRAGSFVHSIEL